MVRMLRTPSQWRSRDRYPRQLPKWWPSKTGGTSRDEQRVEDLLLAVIILPPIESVEMSGGEEVPCH